MKKEEMKNLLVIILSKFKRQNFDIVQHELDTLIRALQKDGSMGYDWNDIEIKLLRWLKAHGAPDTDLYLTWRDMKDEEYEMDEIKKDIRRDIIMSSRSNDLIKIANYISIKYGKA